MVLVASSRSASTALPKEQNQPGRRLEQAAHPAGICRVMCFCRAFAPAEIPVSAMVLPYPTPIQQVYLFWSSVSLKGCTGGEKAMRLSEERPMHDEILPEKLQPRM